MHSASNGRRHLILAGAALAAQPSLFAQSAGYPSRPIRLVVPYPPGGGNDDVARILGDQLSRQVGQPVVIDNRAGGSGTIAHTFVARAEPDGYTLLIDSSNIVMNPWLMRNVPVDVKELTPITLAVKYSNMLLVHPSVPARTTEEFIRHARANPGTINFGTSGKGSPANIDLQIFMRRAGVNVVPIPYKGGGPATQALLANEVQALFMAITALPYIRAGTLRALATLGDKRSALLPDLPTMAEAALPGFTSETWMGFFAPPRTPAAITRLLQTELVKALAAPEVRNRLVEKNFEPVGSSAQEFGAVVTADLARYGAMFRELNIQPD